MRHRKMPQSRIVKCVCLRSRHLRQRKRWGKKRRPRGRLAGTLREMAASSRLTIGVPSVCFSLMDSLYSPLSCSSDVYLTVDDIVPSYAEHSRNFERLSLAAREEGTPERDWRKQMRGEIRRKGRRERDNTTTTRQALAATSNREKMLLRSQRYRALF